jgi:hypothetical protein
MKFTGERFLRTGRLILLLILPAVFALPAQAERTPFGGRTYVFSRSQVKYGLHQNYLHIWLDRPLFQDSSLFPGSEEYPYQSMASWKRNMESVTNYDMDGIAEFEGAASMLDRYLRTLDYNNKLNMHKTFPEIGGFSRGAGADAAEKALAAAAASGTVLRWNGRIPVALYDPSYTSLTDLKEFMDRIKAKYGDTFIFYATMKDNEVVDKIERAWYANDKPALAAAQDEYRRLIRATLDVADGIYWHASGTRTARDPFRFDTEFSRKALVPVVKEVLAEDKYKNKGIIPVAKLAYINDSTGSTTHEDGTLALRSTFETCMLLNPDLINMPEWDEVNENTCLGPTVYNNWSTGRIIRYYMSVLKGERPTPMPGDDAGVPNLIVSYRKLIKLGEPLEIEVLNVPDGQKSGLCTVSIDLKDMSGKVVKSLPQVKLDTEKLSEQRYKLASEDLAGSMVYLPTVKINYKGKSLAYGEGLHHIQMHPTWTWDYKWVKQPLRNIIRPSSAAFEAKVESREQSLPYPYYAMQAKGKFICGEEIASAEIVADGDVEYAVDPRDEYGIEAGNEVFALMFENNIGRTAPLEKGTVYVKGASFKMLPADARFMKQRPDGGYNLFMPASLWPSICYISVPASEVEKGTIEIATDHFKKSIALKDLVKQGWYPMTSGYVMMTLEHYISQPSSPYHLGRKEVAFNRSLYPAQEGMVYNMRVITKSGNIWYSKPFEVPYRAAKGVKTLKVWSEVAEKPVEVKVQGELVPDNTYSFNPADGSTLKADGGRYWSGVLGGRDGYPNGSVPRGGYQTGGTMGIARGVYPEAATEMSPKWVTDEGANCLYFNGKGNYVILPRETAPRGAFTIEMEIKPETAKNCYLMETQGHYPGPLHVRMENGAPVVILQQWSLDEMKFKSKSTLPTGQWSKLKISYDMDKLRVAVNGNEEVFNPPVKRLWFYSQPLVIGGRSESEANWFQGWIRSLRISHMAN